MLSLTTSAMRRRIVIAQDNQLAVVEAGVVPRLVALIDSSLSDDQVRHANSSKCASDWRTVK